ncbi:hypothetical protein LHT11_08845 [Acetobacter indonesiensis]|uniref:hypothetical protein n=1 Tax=Acetobacter indonesiensis TaxID=104101 RepID=UPI001F298431|nr:hypothetical protein [Acetobacter indonesiensis]MCG0995307.1 hypothetical protein [Acetobacter indonesiensis]
MQKVTVPATIIEKIVAYRRSGMRVQDICDRVDMSPGRVYLVIRENMHGPRVRVLSEYRDPTVYELPRYNGALIAGSAVSVRALWRGLERWRGLN